MILHQKKLQESLDKYVKSYKDMVESYFYIHKRVNHIVCVILEYFETIEEYWYFPDESGNESSGFVDFCEIEDKNEVSCVIIAYKNAPLIANGNDYRYSFPYKFLFMTNEEIVNFMNG